MQRIYLDNAASTIMDSEVIETINSVMRDIYGNPSSVHAFGRESRVIVDEARRTISDYLNVSPGEIFFTSGGTEAIVTAISGCIFEREIKHIVTSPIEHQVVLQTLKSFEKRGLISVSFVEIDDKGNIDLENLDYILRTNVKSLVVLMHANNEIGNLLPIKKVSDICSDYNALFLSDMVQTIGKFEIDIKKFDLHFAACSGHKFHGPKGVGFLYINHDVRISPLFLGGGQERNMRAGTENVAGIAGLAKTFEIAHRNMKQDIEHIKSLKNLFITRINDWFPDAKFNGESGNAGLHTILNVSFPKNAKTEMLLMNLDIAGIAVSGGSACGSGVESVSHVIKELNNKPNHVPIRFSFSKFNKLAEIETTISKLKEIII